MTAKELLDREFLEMRCRLIDLAASLDRVGRGKDAAAVQDDSRMRLLHGAVNLLTDGKPERAARMQMHFSDEYRADWKTQFGLGGART